MAHFQDLSCSSFSIVSPLGESINIPKGFFLPGTCSGYQGYFGSGALPLYGTASLAAGPSLTAPFTTNFLGFGLYTGVHTTVGSNITIGNHTVLGATDVSCSAIMQGFNLFRGKVVPEESTTTPSYTVNAGTVEINSPAIDLDSGGSRMAISPVSGSLEGGLWTYGGSAICVAPCSDQRAKKDVILAENSLEKVLNLRGVYFNWEPEVVPKLAENEGRQIGLIAQEVQEVLPEVVRTEMVESQELMSIKYENIVALLIEGMKEQQQQIEELKERIATLEANK